MVDGVLGRVPVKPDLWPVLVRQERTLWVVALVALALDGVLTAYGLSVGFEEANPVASALVTRLGLMPSFAVLKGGALAVALAGRRALPERHAPLVPLALALPWSAGVAVNVTIIATG